LGCACAKSQRAVETYKVVTLDNRGTGRSSVPEGDYSIRTMGDDVAGLLDYLGMSKAHILGESMGGMIAQEPAINHSEKVSSLILSCTTPHAPQREALEKLRWMFAPPPGIPPEAVLEEITRLCYNKRFL